MHRIRPQRQAVTPPLSACVTAPAAIAAAVLIAAGERIWLHLVATRPGLSDNLHKAADRWRSLTLHSLTRGRFKPDTPFSR